MFQIPDRVLDLLGSAAGVIYLLMLLTARQAATDWGWIFAMAFLLLTTAGSLLRRRRQRAQHD